MTFYDQHKVCQGTPFLINHTTTLLYTFLSFLTSDPVLGFVKVEGRDPLSW